MSTDIDGVARGLMLDVAIHAGPGMPAKSVDVCAYNAALHVEAIGIMGRKQRAYGCGNVVAIGGRGVLGRIFEKARRLDQILDHGAPDGGEPARIEAIDISNLALILCQVLDKRWPGAAWVGSRPSREDELRQRVAELEAEVAYLKAGAP